MASINDISQSVDDILRQEWKMRDGLVVPESDGIALAGGAVRLEATFLYADLADSTELAINYSKKVAAKVIKCFLSSCAKIILDLGGSVRSFDGDRVMGVFIGNSKNSTAARCALRINYAFTKIIEPKLLAKYETLREGHYSLNYSIGIDTSEVLVVGAGVRANNDLVWIGRAPNVAAKLSTIRDIPYNTYITEEVFDRLNDSSKYGGTPRELMWKKREWNEVEGITTIYRSSWYWVF